MASPVHFKPAALDDLLKSGPGLPGHTVDALLEQGKVEEARAELERLVLEGLDSGPGIEVTPQFWDDLRAEIRKRTAGRR